MDKMATFKEESSSDQSPLALFASQGIDITPNKDRGVCKASTVVLFCVYITV